MTSISQQELRAIKTKQWAKGKAEEMSTKTICSNCFMYCGIRHLAGCTVEAHGKIFCSHECLHEWEDNQDDYA